MEEFYTRYYAALPHSALYSEYCTRVYGADWGQHGFSDVAQVDALICETRLAPGERTLDIGCGDGRMAEYIGNATGAHVTGLDYIPSAIERAQERTAARRDRLHFVCGDLTRLERVFPPASFDVLISVDTLYFGNVGDLVRQMKALLRPGGRMGIFYAHGADPGHPIETFPRETLTHENGPLGTALRDQALPYQAWDFTADDYRHAQLKKRVLEELLARRQGEDDRFLLESRMGEAVGVIAACEAVCQARHLFVTAPLPAMTGSGHP
jgi:SAM-dependent methyltransferase